LSSPVKWVPHSRKTVNKAPVCYQVRTESTPSDCGYPITIFSKRCRRALRIRNVETQPGTWNHCVWAAPQRPTQRGQSSESQNSSWNFCCVSSTDLARRCRRCQGSDTKPQIAILELHLHCKSCIHCTWLYKHLYTGMYKCKYNKNTYIYIVIYSYSML
jgi:hypothetical protein